MVSGLIKNIQHVPDHVHWSGTYNYWWESRCFACRSSQIQSFSFPGKAGRSYKAGKDFWLKNLEVTIFSGVAGFEWRRGIISGTGHGGDRCLHWSICAMFGSGRAFPSTFVSNWLEITVPLEAIGSGRKMCWYHHVTAKLLQGAVLVPAHQVLESPSPPLPAITAALHHEWKGVINPRRKTHWHPNYYYISLR